jgi:hypothetical protein
VAYAALLERHQIQSVPLDRQVLETAHHISISELSRLVS